MSLWLKCCVFAMNGMSASLMIDCVGLGLTVLDQLGVIERFPEPNSKNVLSSWTVQGGGPVATALAMLARLGKRCSLVTALGDDPDGRFLQQDLHALNVDTAFSKITDGQTPRAFILVDQSNGERTVFLHRDPRCTLTAADIAAQPYDQCRLLHIDGHYPAADLCAAERVHRGGGLVSIDLGSNRRVDPALLEACDIIVVSEAYAAGQIAGDLESGLEKLFTGYAKWVGITCGARGSYFFDGIQHLHQPAFPVAVADSTGAGDVFHGAILYAVLQKFSLAEAAVFAAAAAAIKCRSVGRNQGMADLQQIKQFLNIQQVSTPFLG